MDFYPNSALVAPIIPANQQLQTAAQTAALQQRSALEAQQTQGAALANQEAQLTLQDQQLWAQHMLEPASQSSNPNNASTTIANDLSNPSGATSQATAPQTSIPPALAPNTDQSQALQPGAIGLTTTGAPANTAALAPQIPPMLARVAPNQGAAPSLGQQASAPIQAATTQQAPLYTWSPNGKAPDGQATPGNIDLTKITPTQNIQDPSKWSTVNSTSFQDENPKSPTYGKEVLVRGYLNGQTVDPTAPGVMDQLKAQYYKTGQNLGVFNNGDTADIYAQQLHSDWEAGKIPGVQMKPDTPATQLITPSPQQSQAATAPISTQPHPLAGLPSTGSDFAAQMQNAMNDPRIRPTYKMQMQKQIVGMANAQAELSKNQTEATQKQQALQQGYRDDSVRLFNGYLAGDPWETTRNRAIAEGIPGADKWPTTDPGIQQVQTWQHSLRGLNAEKDFFTLTYPKMQQDGSNVAAQTADQITPDGSNYPTWRANQVKQNFAMDQILPQTYQGPQTITQIKQLPLSAQDRLKAPGDIAQSDEAITKAAAQDLSNVKTPEDLAAWNARYPRIFNPPKTVAEIPAFQLRAVPIKEQPAYNIEKKSEAQIAQMTPTDWDQQIKSASGGDQGLADRTKSLVSMALAGGDLKGAKAVIKDAADQVGRVQVAKEEAKNRVTINAGGLSTGPNGEPSETAKMVANYQIPFTRAAFRLTADQQNALNGQIKQINPQFKAGNYDIYQSTEKAFTSERQADQIRNISTMMGHLSTLNNAADLLGNGDLPALNKIANFWGVQSGKDPVTVYRAIVHRLGPEITSAYIAGGGTAGDRNTNETDFDPSLGAKQIKSNIGASAQLAGSLIDGFQAQYDRGTFGRGQQQLLPDEAQAARQKLAGQSPVKANTSGKITVTDPTGKPHYFDTQAQADQFKKLANIK